MALPPTEGLAAARILVALGDAGAALDALSTASLLAARLRAELHGLYVEDIDLLRLAGLPFARSVGHASALPQPLDFASLERAFRQQAARMRAMVAEMAGRERLAWSFQVARGRLLEEVMGQAGSADLLVFCRTFTLRRSVAGPVLVLLRRTDEVERLLPVGRDLAAEGGGLLAAAATPALLESAREWLRRQGVAARLAEWPETAGTALAARERARVLVIGAGNSLSGEDNALLAEANCPVVVARPVPSGA